MFAEAGSCGHTRPAEPAIRRRRARIGWFAEKNGWNRAVEDIGAVADAVMRTREGLPRVLFGYSMGTILSRCYIQKHDGEVAALVLTGAPNPNPAAKPGKAMASLICATRGQYYRSPMMNSMLFGSFNKKVKDPLTDSTGFRDGETFSGILRTPCAGYVPASGSGYAGRPDAMADGTLYSAKTALHTVRGGECDPCTGRVRLTPPILKNGAIKM